MGTKGTSWSAQRRARFQASLVPARDRILARFEADTNGGCWLWTGALVHSTGYGTIGINGRTVGAHRASYETFVGAVPTGLVVCHKCDVRCCVNPAHLFAGTAQDNMDDMLRKGRKAILSGSRTSMAILSEADIPVIRRLIAAGRTNRSIGDRFGVSPDVINAIRAGRSWKHVPEIQWSDPMEKAA